MKLKTIILNILKLSPIPISKNHRYDMLTKKIIKNLATDANCIDVGCFKGEILDLIQNAAPKGQHHGIEPIPKQYEFLKSKYASKTNCNIHNIAASDKTGESTFNYVTSNPSYSGLIKRDYDKPNEVDTKIQVKTDLLDNVIPKDLVIDLIKIDVEGAELQVLLGASEIVEKYKPLVVFEHGLGASEHYGTTPELVFEYFSSKSMRISNLKSFINKKPHLSLHDFSRQYNEKINYYFVAHK